MLGIILNILKIIGIILLILLAFIILMLCVILFAPIRYRAEGNYKDKYLINAKVSWLLHLFSLRIRQSSVESLHIIFKIAGLTVYDNTRPARTSKRTKKKKKKSNDQHEIPEEATQIHAASAEASEENISSTSKEKSVHKDNFISDESNTHNKLTILQKIHLLFLKFVHFLQNIKYTFRKFYDTIVNIKSNICYYCDLLLQDTTKAAFAAANKQIIRIVKNLKPRQWRIYLHIGMEDPAAMGDILGIWGMLYPLHEGHIEIEPEFDHNVFEAEFSFKGRIHIFVYLWTAYIILFDKNIKQLKKCLLREEG